MKKQKSNNEKQFVRHFRIYFRSGHSAYIVDEDGNLYLFHRVTHSKTSGGKKNWKKDNPLVLGGDEPTYIVKKEEKDKKKRFSPFVLQTKQGADISYPEIKKAGRSQTEHGNAAVVNNNCPSTNIKTHIKTKDKKKR